MRIFRGIKQLAGRSLSALKQVATFLFLNIANIDLQSMKGMHYENSC